MKYDIWSEGYLATGMEDIPAKAKLVARGIEGKDFIDACYNWARKNENNLKDWGGINISINTDKSSVSLWACRLFPTEAEARKSFG